MTQLEQLRGKAMAAAEEAAQALEPLDALRGYSAGRSMVFVECNRLGVSDEVREQLVGEHAQRFALKSGLMAFWAMRSSRRGA